MTKSMIAQSAKYGMGTIIANRVFGELAEEALKAAEKETARLEEILSRFIPDSDISRINKSAGIKDEVIGSETYEVLSRAVEFSQCSQGCFDITVGPVMDLWRSSREAVKPPEEAKLRQILYLVNYHDLVFEPDKKAVSLKKAGQSLDLGGIGKGFAADKILEIFRTYNVTSAFTNLGGNVAAIGAKPDGSPWRIGIRHPRQDHNLIGVVSVINKSVVTSGDYQCYFIGSNGKRYHHILDPQTGYPAESELISVTVAAESSLAADALSTILFTTGMKTGLELLKLFPGTEAIFIDINLKVYVTQGLQAYFQTCDDIKMNILY